MAAGRRGFLHYLPWPCATLRPSERGGLTVDWTTSLALIVAAVLVIYLTAALLAPEKFS